MGEQLVVEAGGAGAGGGGGSGGIITVLVAFNRQHTLSGRKRGTQKRQRWRL